MKHHLLGLVSLVLILAACRASTGEPTSQPSVQPGTQQVLTSTEPLPSVTLAPTPTPVPSSTATSTPTIYTSPTITATPAPIVDLHRFDFDVWPPIDVSHISPLIARLDEVVKLEFGIHYHVSNHDGRDPDLRHDSVVRLFVAYGSENDFKSIPLVANYKEYSDRPYSTSIRANDKTGQSLRYYLLVEDRESNITVRYPTAGALDIFVVSEFIPVNLAAQKPVEYGKVALKLPWGDGPEAVKLQEIRVGYPWRVGPLAMDVADDGRIALLDRANKRVLLFDPAEKRFTSIPLSFFPGSNDDVQFDRNGQVAVLDRKGEPLGDQSTVRIPRLYRFLPDGQIGAVAPIFAQWPSWLTGDMQVFDWDDQRLVSPFDASGEPNSREIQRQKQSPRLIVKYNDTGTEIWFVDREKGIAFDLHSASGFGAPIGLETTPSGYVAVFGWDQIRAIWFDLFGNVLKDVTLPNRQYSEVYPQGQAAIDQNGSLYVMDTTQTGVFVWYVQAP